MQSRRIHISMLTAVFITGLAVWAYEDIPPIKFEIAPSSKWHFSLTEAFMESEVTLATWINEDQKHLSCTNTIPSDKIPNCTINIFLSNHYSKGVDLSRYDTLVMETDFSGEIDKVRVFMRNFNPIYSNVEDANSAKFMTLLLNTSELEASKPIRIDLREFIVADWWLNQRSLDRKYLPVEFNNVTVLGFDFSEYLEADKSLELRFSDLHFEGPRILERHWYLGIVIMWVALVSLLLAFEMFNLIRKNRLYSSKISELSDHKAHFEKQTEKYRELSHLDSLTQTLNRYGLAAALARLMKDPEQFPAGVILLDIDHFKRINDRKGHIIGDQVLQGVATVIAHNIREHDVLARWGGEEFVLIIPNTSSTVAFHVAEKIRAAITQFEFHAAKNILVTASFGVTVMQASKDFESVLKRADTALYHAKNQGRNCCILDPGENTGTSD